MALINYYSDELNDEFSEAKIIPRVIDGNYKYKHGKVWNFCSYMMQNVLSMPIKMLYMKIKFKHVIIGKEKLKPYNKIAYFIYGNHTQAFGDVLIPSLAMYPKRNFFIVNPENISMGHSGWAVELLGAIPVPGDIESTKNFLDILKYRISKKHAITIYPEAHIWPYYTKIRNFKDVSFKYPVQLNTPVFCFTNTYIERKHGVQITTFIDGPFYPDKKLTKMKDKQKDLRNQVYLKMVDRSQNSNIEVIKYIKK
jgi:hypothetical protein